ncbi:DUF4136 domain-containing protein [Deefgea salmonis]|uniref:DUF4136 domain-containing protein n=1 Tax=Deefgea salmonis TaxID=2875502 RepID=A0ABS8BKW6_9NEIS|nr:DUF4136 domain-containing protein [Deefgea salmonis]MCB5196365.1 DUF4136 domain-containing protein [Deefgea salmonis]
MKLRGWSAVVGLMLLAGCANTFVSQVSVRHDLPASMAGKVFAIDRPRDDDQSLARYDFENLLATELRRQGLVQQADPKLADWLVQLDYQIDDGKNASYQQPIWGTIGYSVSYQRINTGGGIAFIPRYYPETGIIGSQTINETLFTREVFVDILDRKALAAGEFAKLYEGRARNRSLNDVLDPAVPWLIRSLFLPFPGPSGVTREVRQVLPETK